MVKLPQTGIVPMTLRDTQAPLAWVATDSNGHQHRISSRWVFTTFSTKETNLSHLVHLLRYTLFYFTGQWLLLVIILIVTPGTLQ